MGLLVDFPVFCLRRVAWKEVVFRAYASYPSTFQSIRPAHAGLLSGKLDGG